MLEAYQRQLLQHTEEDQHQQQTGSSTLPSSNMGTTTTLLTPSNQQQQPQSSHELDPRTLQLIIMGPTRSIQPWLTDPDYIDVLRMFLFDETT